MLACRAYACFLAGVPVGASDKCLYSSDDEQGSIDNGTFFFETSTTPTTFEFTCIYPPGVSSNPLNTPLGADYTATATTFKLIYTLGNGGVDVNTYTKK